MNDDETPQMPRRFGALAIGVALAFGALNILAALDSRVGNTISATVTDLFDLNIAAPLAASIILGHWATRDMALPQLGPWGFAVTAAIILAAGVTDHLLGGWIAERYPSLLIVLAGLVIGGVLWTMHPTEPN